MQGMLERLYLEKLAADIRKPGEWNLQLLEELCVLADMGEAWKAAYADTFEAVAFAAAAKLGVEIVK